MECGRKTKSICESPRSRQQSLRNWSGALLKLFVKDILVVGRSIGALLDAKPRDSCVCSLS